MRMHVSQRPLRQFARHPGNWAIAPAQTPGDIVSKTRVASKTCHVLALCLTAWIGSKVLGVLHDLLQSGGGATRGLAGLVDVLACVLTLAVTLVAVLVLAVLEGVAVTVSADDQPASPALRQYEWQLALLWAAPAGLALLGLAVVNAWFTW